MQGAELSYGSATELVDAMAGGAVSAVELANEAIGRIERYDTSLNAVCVPDFERALEAARAADAARAQGRFAELAERELGGFTPPPGY